MFTGVKFNWGVVVLGLSISVAALAQDGGGVENRDVQIGVDGVIAGTLTDCTVSVEPYADINDKMVFKMTDTFTYNACIHRRRYKVSVTGRFWDTKETVVPGSQEEYFKLEQITDNKTSDFHPESTNPQGISTEVRLMSVQRKQECFARRKGYELAQRPMATTGCGQTR